ncbi:MAG TPA: branched-chain amino acid ABC transporter permease [Thermodesulfobacteriota bacterium]|nr:branched-chain amino acid ABC transporter permease [Thermodesulfobacteriota bacterium]
MINLHDKTYKIILLIALVVCAVFPYIVSGFWIRLLTSIFLYAILAQGLNIIAGFTGYAAFGNMIFFGLGGYTVGILMAKAGISFFPSLIAAGAVGIIVAILIGMPLLRLKGHYFALASLGAAEAVRQIMDNLTDLCGGAMGLTLPQMAGKPAQVNLSFYYLIFILLLIFFGATYFISKNRLGYALKAIKANEEAADAMGINTTLYKIVAWAISGIFTAIAGGIYAYWFTFIEPATVFDVMIVVKLFVILLLGGAGTVMGPLYGAFIFEGISEIVWSRFLNLHMGILGIIVILIVFFVPNGLIDMVRRGFRLRTILDTIREEKV